MAIYSVLTDRKEISAMQLSKQLGAQCKTDWDMLHRICKTRGNGKEELTTDNRGSNEVIAA